MLKKAILLSGAGETEKAREILEKGLIAFPKNKKVKKQLENICQDASASVSRNPSQRVIAKLVNDFNHGDMGNVVSQAESLSKQYPKSIIAWNLYGVASANLGHMEEAIKAFESIIAIDPVNAEAHNNLGAAFNLQGMPYAGLKVLQKACELKPDYAEAHNNIGNSYKILRKNEQAIKSFRRAVALKPNFPNALNNLGFVLSLQGELEEALSVVRNAIDINSNYADAYDTLGTILKYQGYVDSSLEAHHTALTLNENHKEAYNNIGTALVMKGYCNAAIGAFKKSLEIDPNFAQAHMNLAFSLIKRGDLTEGLEEFDWRWRLPKNAPHFRHFPVPRWDGEVSLRNKKILIWSEQGVGDTINWSSNLESIASEAGHCILECPEKIAPLLKRSFKNIEVIPTDKRFDAVRADIDFNMPLGDLWKHSIHRFSESSIGKAHLFPDPQRIIFWRNRLQLLGNGPYVGIAWKSANMSPERMPNYAPIVDWAPLLSRKDITFINLQYCDFSYDIEQVHKNLGVRIHNFEDIDLFDDLDEVAALCKALDTVVATTCAVPLLSAAVGTQTKFASWKQSSWNNVVYNPAGPALETYYKNTEETWQKVFNSISNDMET